MAVDAAFAALLKDGGRLALAVAMKVVEKKRSAPVSWNSWCSVISEGWGAERR